MVFLNSLLLQESKYLWSICITSICLSVGSLVPLVVVATLSEDSGVVSLSGTYLLYTLGLLRHFVNSR